MDVIIQSSFGGMLEIEAKMESNKHIVDEALETINVECSFRSLRTDGWYLRRHMRSVKDILGGEKINWTIILMGVIHLGAGNC